MSFNSSVNKHFKFLKSEYGFETLKTDFGFVKGDLELLFYGGNGQVDINFYVRKSDEIFKPFISRAFDLHSVLRRLKPNGFESYPSSVEGYLTNSADINSHLGYYGRMLKEHCEHILNGDLSVLEEIHLERREIAKKTK